MQSEKDGGGPSQQRTADEEFHVRQALRAIASEQDVPVPSIPNEVLCSELNDTNTEEYQVWLDPTIGYSRTAVEQIVARRLLLDKDEEGSNTTRYIIPSDAMYSHIVLTFVQQRFTEYHFLKRV